MKDLKESDEPSAKKSSTEMVAPKRANDLIDSVAPQFTKSRTETVAANLDKPITAILDPKRAKLRNDKEEPK
jgi:hypothetical protein